MFGNSTVLGFGTMTTSTRDRTNVLTKQLRRVSYFPVGYVTGMVKHVVVSSAVIMI